MSPRRCRHVHRLVLAARRSDRVVYPELVDSVLAMRIVAADDFEEICAAMIFTSALGETSV